MRNIQNGPVFDSKWSTYFMKIEAYRVYFDVEVVEFHNLVQQTLWINFREKKNCSGHFPDT